MSESEKANQLVSPEAQVMASEQDVNDGLDRIGEALVEKNAQIDSLTAEVERLKKECASRRPAERRVRPMSKQSEAIVDAISKQCIDGFWFDCKKAIAIVDSHVASLTADNERLRVGIRDIINDLRGAPIIAAPESSRRIENTRYRLAALLQPESNDDK